MNMKMNKHFLPELNKLMIGLAERGIPFTFEQCYDGGKVDVPSQDWDAICHGGSYGSHSGLLEVMGSKVVRNTYDMVQGYLTAAEILDRVDE